MNWFDLAVTIILSAVKDAVKNPEKKAVLRPAMLKVASMIVALWDDAAFHSDLELRTDYERSKMNKQKT